MFEQPFLQSYVDHAIRVLNLPFAVAVYLGLPAGHEDEKCVAMIQDSVGWKFNLHFNPKFGPNYDLRHVVAHELLHCHMRPMEWMIETLEDESFQNSFSKFEEAFIEQMERVLAELLPTPQQFRKLRKKETTNQ